MPDQIRAGDLIALAAIIIGFGATIIAFRIQREAAMEEADERVWLPWADWLILIAVALCVVFVVLLLATVTRWRIAFASAAGAAAMVLEGGYIPSILAHYRILFGKDRAEKGILREPGEPAEVGFVIVTAVVAALTFGFVFCQQH